MGGQVGEPGEREQIAAARERDLERDKDLLRQAADFERAATGAPEAEVDGGNTQPKLVNSDGLKFISLTAANLVNGKIMLARGVDIITDQETTKITRRGSFYPSIELIFTQPKCAISTVKIHVNDKEFVQFSASELRDDLATDILRTLEAGVDFQMRGDERLKQDVEGTRRKAQQDAMKIFE